MPKAGKGEDSKRGKSTDMVQKVETETDSEDEDDVPGLFIGQVQTNM